VIRADPAVERVQKNGDAHEQVVRGDETATVTRLDYGASKAWQTVT
jgi:hypothetical protein